MRREKWESGLGGTIKKNKRERIAFEFTLQALELTNGLHDDIMPKVHSKLA